MTFYNRNGKLYVSINGKRISTKLLYSNENIKLFKSYAKNEEFFKKFNIVKKNKKLLDFCEEVLDYKERYLKPTSYSAYTSLFNSQIVPYFKDKKIEDIEPIDIKHFFQRFKSKSSLYICSNAILKPAFENAILEKYIKYSPMQIATPVFKSKYEINPFNLDEIKLILDNAVTLQLRNMLGLLFYSGMRIGEALALKWENVCFNTYTIKITQTNTQGFTNTPKTKASLRTIDMLQQAEYYLKQQKEINNSPYVFTDSKNKPIRASSNLTNHWNLTLKKCNLEIRSKYQTRHSFASNMLSNGEALMWVSKMLGHSNSSTTLLYYSKYLPVNTKERKKTFLDA